MENGPDEWHSVYLRNHGINDLVINRTLRSDQVGAQTGIPCVVYINGEYNGIRWFQEKQDKGYISTNYGYSKSEIVKFQYLPEKPDIGLIPVGVPMGDRSKYSQLFNDFMETLNTLDIHDTSTVEFIKDHFDTHSFFKVKIISGFHDKPESASRGTNTKLFWNSKDSIFREMIRDFDATMMDWEARPLFNRSYNSHSLLRVRAGIFNRFIKNEELKNEYLNLAADLFSTSLSAEHISKDLTYLCEYLEPHVTQHYDRWSHIPSSISRIQRDLDSRSVYTVLMPFALKRTSAIFGYFMEDFKLDTTSVYFKTLLTGSDCEAERPISVLVGGIQNNEQSQWTSRVSFTGIPVSISASGPGFQYFEINGVQIESLDSFIFEALTLYRITAVFACDESDDDDLDMGH